MPRNLCEVIDQMLAIIPKTETEFRDSLWDNRSSAEYISPETLGLRWKVAAETLEDFMPNENIPPANWQEWQRQVVDVWQGNSDWRNNGN